MIIDRYPSTIQMHDQRRLILKSSLNFAALTVLGSAAILSPRQAQAAWAREAFTAPGMAEAVQQALGKDKGIRSDEVVIDAPSYIKDPSIVEVTVSSGLPEVNAIAILVRENLLPLAALYMLPENTEPFVTTRLDIHRTTEVVAVIRSGRKLYSNFRQIIVIENLSPSINTLDEYPLELDAEMLDLLE
jgi:sulfur-oxidizing protein SoxY